MSASSVLTATLLQVSMTTTKSACECAPFSRDAGSHVVVEQHKHCNWAFKRGAGAETSPRRWPTTADVLNSLPELTSSPNYRRAGLSQPFAAMHSGKRHRRVVQDSQGRSDVFVWGMQSEICEMCANVEICMWNFLLNQLLYVVKSTLMMCHTVWARESVDTFQNIIMHYSSSSII